MWSALINEELRPHQAPFLSLILSSQKPAELYQPFVHKKKPPATVKRIALCPPSFSLAILPFIDLIFSSSTRLSRL